LEDKDSIMDDGLKIISGSIYPELAEKIAQELNVELVSNESKRFANTEQYVRIGKSVRGDKVFIIQSMAERNGYNVDESVVETMLLIDAAKRASASEITVVLPYLAYGRQDRKARGREPISAAAIIRAFQSAGADRLVSIDMHTSQMQAVFNGPFDHLTAEPELQKALKKIISQNPNDQYVVVAPDAGGVKTAEDYALALGIPALHIPKVRRGDEITRDHAIEGVEGKTAIIIDDMVDTAGTLVSAAEVLQKAGTGKILVATTHGILSDPAIERLESSAIDKMIVTNSIDNKRAKEILGDRFEIVSIHGLIANAIARINDGGSVSEMFDGRNYK